MKNNYIFIVNIIQHLKQVILGNIQVNQLRNGYSGNTYGYVDLSLDYSTGSVKLGDLRSYGKGGRYVANGTGYGVLSCSGDQVTTRYYKRVTNVKYSRGNFISYVAEQDGKYANNTRNDDSYWYVKNGLALKYKLYKYDQDLILKSIYDVDTKTITTIPIDISNKGNNKVKLTLSTSGSTYKTYISNDNTTWQEITDIVSGTPKELDVDGWNNLYLKIEANTSRIDNIDVAYYKD